MISFRFLQLVIASACLSTLVKGDEDRPLVQDRPPFDEFQIELCDLPCANNGRCVAYDMDNDGVLDPQCFCNTTFQGELCETPRTCSLDCENGGTCNLGDAWWLSVRQDDVNFLQFFKEILYRCSLVEGQDCRIFPDMQEERCNCPSGTQGQLCETTCDKTCLNGGQCNFWGQEQRCSCAGAAFYGDQCENECTKACQNGGFCFPSSNGSGGLDEQCLCPVGFEGENCEVEIPCPLTCQNEGICKFYDAGWVNEIVLNPDFLQVIIERCNVRDVPITECLGGYQDEPGAYCDCPNGTLGSNCEVTCDLDCQNGSCEFYGRRNQHCRCDPGFAGDLCQYPCSKNCGNHGICNANATGEFCQCSPFYEGEFCDTERTCDLTCQNGGNCVFLGGYREDYDDKYFEDCLLHNNIGCPQLEDIQRCNCTAGFVGSDCGTPCPCQNGGRCSTRYFYRNRMLEEFEENMNEEQEEEEYGYEDDFFFGEQVANDGGYFCECPFGYYGRDCEAKYDSENCALDCQNGGYCQADLGWHEGEGDDAGWEEEEEIVNNNNSNQNYYQNGRQSNNGDRPYNNNGGIDNNVFNYPTGAPILQRPFEYCVCADGFRGVSCEVEIDACNNQCQNGGVCTTDSTVGTQGTGHRALEDVAVTPRPGLVDTLGYCSCPEGFSGEYCERKTCGSGYCSHGGTCVELPAGQTTSAGDDYVCDCSTSTLEGNSGIGRNCDSMIRLECPFVNSKKNPNEPWSCAGWGRCFVEGRTPGCLCASDSFMGPRCEFNRTDPKDVAWSECNLQCSNGGICLKGATKPVAEIFIPFMEGTQKSGLFDYQTPDFEYCYCPDGFFGVQCDIQYDICGNGDHICFHGSKCKNNGGEWGCDCDGTESAGLYCQYKATDDCGDSDPETFCTNDATCTNGVCACKEGWEGSKCETEIKLAAPAGGGDNNWSSAPVTGTLASVLSLIAVALVVG